MARPRKYTLDENYFDTINSSNKAYILGFIYADGSVSKRGNLTICLSKKDTEILEFIKEELNYSGVISSKLINKNEYSLLSIDSKVMVNRLIELGIVPNKTYNSSVLPTIPKEYFNDTLRGYFDGDGSIYKNGEKGFTVCFSSNINILNSLKSYFDDLTIKTSNIRLRNKNSEYSAMLEIRGNNQIIKIKNLLYSESNIFYLKRKYNKFVEFEEYILNMTKRNHSFEIINEVKNLYLKGISQKDIHLILAIPYSSVRNVVQRLRKLKKII